MAAACVRNIWTHTFISFSLSQTRNFVLLFHLFVFEIIGPIIRHLKNVSVNTSEKRKKNKKEKGKNDQHWWWLEHSPDMISHVVFFFLLPWWSTHEMITWRCNDLCLQGPPVRWSRQSSENKKTDDELDKISTSRRTPQKQGGSTSSNSQTQNKTKKNVKIFISFLTCWWWSSCGPPKPRYSSLWRRIEVLVCARLLSRWAISYGGEEREKKKKKRTTHIMFPNEGWDKWGRTWTISDNVLPLRCCWGVA